MLSYRSVLSLCQFLALQARVALVILMQKYGLPTDGLSPSRYKETLPLLEVLPTLLGTADQAQFHQLLSEIVSTSGNMRNSVSTRYEFDERFADLERCLQLDGYRLENGQLSQIDPDIAGAEAVEDDLTTALCSSGLQGHEDIASALEKSANAFRRSPPDHNACLTNARVALDTLAMTIANARQASLGDSLNNMRWGPAVAYLRTSGLITEEEEVGLTGVYRFVSPGAHRPVGIDNAEIARLGRGLVISMCYFLLQAYTLRE